MRTGEPNQGSGEAEMEVHAPTSQLCVLESVNSIHRFGSTSGLGSHRSTGMSPVAPTTHSRYDQSVDMFDGFRSVSWIPRAGPEQAEHGKLITASLSLEWNLTPQPTCICQQLARATSETLRPNLTDNFVVQKVLQGLETGRPHIYS